MAEDEKELEERVLDEKDFNDLLIKSMQYYAGQIAENKLQYNDCVDLINQIDWYKSNGYRIIYKQNKGGLYIETEKKEIGFNDEKER